MRDPLGGKHVGAGGNADQQPLFLRQKLRRLVGLIVLHEEDLVQNRAVQDLRDEPGADALNFVGTGVSPREHRGAGRLNRDDPNIRLPLFEDFPASRNRAARPHRGNKRVDPSIQRLPDLERRRRAVYGRIGGIGELVRHKVRGVLSDDAFGLLDRPFHALPGGGQHELSAVRRQQAGAFHAHAFGHDEDQVVPADSGDQGQPDPRIAARGLDDRRPGLNPSLALGLVQHVEADTVLDASARIGGFKLRIDRRRAFFGQPVQADHGRPADELGDVLVRRGRHWPPPM